MSLSFKDLAMVQSIIREVTGYAAVVAGGAVRDIRLGRPVKDIDVLIPRDRDSDVFTEHEQRPVAHLVGQALTGKRAQVMVQDNTFRITSESGYTAADDEQVYATYEVDTSWGVVNLIFVSDMIEALNEFPDTISQAYISDEGEPLFSDGFERAAETRVIETLLDADNKRIVRLSAKFPGFLWAKVDKLEYWE